VKTKRGYKRGYPVALLVGFEKDEAVLWQVFSQVVKPLLTLKLVGSRTDESRLYEFHESIVDALRPTIKEGVRSIVMTAPLKTTYSIDFLKHVQKHHNYLLQTKGTTKATFAQLIGSANEPHKVAELVRRKEFQDLIVTTTSGEADQIVAALEKSLNANQHALFSLVEIEDMIYCRDRKEHFNATYMILTDKYLAESPHKNRVHRLLQISANKKVTTRIIKSETPAGKRITQFGGIVFFTLQSK
jgi:stalled ribosome rescue protein Dom34